MERLLPPVLPAQSKGGNDERPSVEHREERIEARERRRRRKEGEDDGHAATPPPSRRKGATLTRDQWTSVLVLLLVVIGGSKLSFWLFVHAHDTFCIAFNLSCKPKGY